MASHLVPAITGFPETVVVTYTRLALAEILEHYPSKVIAEINTSAVTVPVYEIDSNGIRLAVYCSTIGGPAAAAIMEETIAMGGKRFLYFGSCGALEEHIMEGAIAVPTAAWRDEGVSYHYVPAADLIEIPTATRLCEILTDLGIAHHATITWTTDAIYRETRATVEKRKSAGCGVVEMECASTAAVAQFRGVEFYQFLFGADSLAADEWDARTLVDHPRDLSILLAQVAIQVAERL